MKHNSWDRILTPPKGGYEKLQKKISTKETEKSHFRLMLITFAVVFFFLLPQLKHSWLNKDPVGMEEWKILKLTRTLVSPDKPTNKHLKLIRAIRQDWIISQKQQPSQIVYEGEHYRKIIIR